MALSSANVDFFFKVLGKLVFIYNQAESQQTQYNKVMMALVNQAIDADASKIDLYELVIVPFNAKTTKSVKSINDIGTTVISHVNIYLTKVFAIQAEIAQPTVLKVLDELRAKMMANGLYITAGGVFDQFFTEILKYNSLPKAGETLMSDAYVADDVV